MGLTAIVLAVAAITYFRPSADVDTEPESPAVTSNMALPSDRDGVDAKTVQSESSVWEPDAAQSRKAPSKTLENGAGNTWPAGIEDRIWQYFAHRGKSNIISINSVKCTDTECEIEFYSTDINPQYVDDFSDLTDGMYRENWNVTSSSTMLRETAPGVRALVVRLSNVPVDIDRLRSEEKTAQEQSKDLAD